jgi:hypothetical protein
MYFNNWDPCRPYSLQGSALVVYEMVYMQAYLEYSLVALNSATEVDTFIYT